MTSIQYAHSFVSKWYSVEEGETVERKSFTRFREAMPPTMDAATIEAAYTAFSGKSPRYNKATTSMAPWQAEEYKNNANRIVDALTHDPTSFTDLYNRSGLNRYHTNGVPLEPTGSLRKCFKAMAQAGIIGCVEVKTCGKCAIRLYYLND